MNEASQYKLLGMNSLFCNKKQIFGKGLSQTNVEYSPEVLNMKELRSTCSNGLEVPYQHAFKDKPAFNKRLIKVLVARNLFLVHISSCNKISVPSKAL